MHPLQIIKSVPNKVLHALASLIFNDVAYRLKGGHQDDGAWLPLAADIGHRSRSDTPPKEYDVLFFKAKNLVDVVIHIECRLQYVFLGGIKNIARHWLVNVAASPFGHCFQNAFGCHEGLVGLRIQPDLRLLILLSIEYLQFFI